MKALMKNWLYLFVGIGLAVVVSASCSVKTSDLYEDGGLLWQVSGNGLRDTSYLLGSMHNIKGTFMDSILGARKAFDEAEQLAVENDYLSRDSASYSFKSYLYMPADTTYEMLYHDLRQYEYVDSTLKAMQFFRYEAFKPLFWMSLLESIKGYKGLERKDIMDIYILLQGIEHKKEIVYLEETGEVDRRQERLDSLRYQAIDLPLQAYFLHESLRNFSKKEDGSRMIQAYKGQNFRLLSEIIVSERDSVPEETEMLTKERINRLDSFLDCFYRMTGSDRNHAWMSKLPGLMQKKPTLVVVGVAHLAGEEGLISLLRKEGYEVKPVIEK